MDILRGTVLLWRNPRLWGIALAPLFAAVVLYTALGVGGGFVMIPLLREWFGGSVPPWLAAAGFVVAWVLLFPFLFALLVGAFAGVIFEPLSLAVERVVRGETVPKSGATVPFTDTLARLTLAVTLAALSLLLGFVFGVVPGILAASMVALLDYTSPAFARRGKLLSAQWRELIAKPKPDAASFALVAGLFSVLPIIGVLMIPGMVAGGTLLALRRETASVPPPPTS